MKILKTLVLFGIVFLTFSGLFAQSFPLSPNAFTNPDFIKRMLGEYGVLTDLEPKINQDQIKILQAVAQNLETDDPKQALKTLDDALKDIKPQTDHTALYFTRGQIHTMQGHHQLALKDLNLAIKAFPNFFRAYKVALINYMQTNQYDKAYAYILKVLELKGGDGDIYGFLGYLHLNQQRYFSAQKAYEMALAYYPDRLSLKKGLLESLRMQSKHKDTIALSKELFDGEDGELDTSYLLIMGNAYLALERYDEAFGVLKIAYMMGDKSARELLSRLYLNKGFYNEAVAIYAQVFKGKKRPPLKEAIKPLRFMAYEGHTQGALDYVDLLQKHYTIKDVNQEADVLSLKAKMLNADGQPKQAQKLLENILKKAPLHFESLHLLIEHHTQNEKFLQATLLCERLYATDRLYEAYLICARVSMMDENYKKAYELYQKAYEQKNSPQLLDNINAIKALLKG